MSNAKTNADKLTEVTQLELGFVGGVTSDVQTQLDGKLDGSGDVTVGAGNFSVTGVGQFVELHTPSTMADRVKVRNSQADAPTRFTVEPNGTGTTSQLFLKNSTDNTNYNHVAFSAGVSFASISVANVGTATTIPFYIVNGGKYAFYHDPSDFQLGIGTNNPTAVVDVYGYIGATPASADAGALLTLRNADYVAGDNRVYQFSETPTNDAVMYVNGFRDYSVSTAGGEAFTIDGTTAEFGFRKKFGYKDGLGIGSTVTQITSKATGVTLNTLTGKITTHNQGMSGGAIVSFVVTNSTVTADDVVMVNIDSALSGATVAGHYTLWTSSDSGLFNVHIQNATTGVLAEAFTLNFVVIKGAAS